MWGNLFREKGFPHTPSKKHSHNNYPNKIVSSRIDSRRAPLGALLLSQKIRVAKRRGGNEKHHSVVFEPHRDRTGVRPTETLIFKKVE